MTPSRYLVIQCGGAWAIRGGNRTFGPFSDRIHAIDAAIDYAETDGKAGRPAKVLVQEDGRHCEPFGLMDATRTRARQAMPRMAGPTGHIACHDLRRRQTVRASESWVIELGSAAFPRVGQKE